jgi:tetratricopeptide (TPR) repeat protein
MRRTASILGSIAAGAAAALVAAAALAPDVTGSPPPPVPAPSLESASPVPPPSSPLKGVTLDQLRKGLAADVDAKRRRAVVKLLLRAEVGDAPVLHHWLHRRTGHAPADYKALLQFLGVEVPDRHGRFNQPARNPELDWLEGLLALPVEKLSRPLHQVYADTTLQVALIRALAGTGHHDAPVSLLRFAYRHRSAFKDECGRQIRSMGVHAVPGLVRARALRDDLAYKIVRYAAYQLDRIDCARPEKALKQADPELRAEILHAYGEVRDPTAVAAVLRYTDAASRRVRRAARWATLRYVSGRPPKVVKRKLKLPGGRETSAERALYLTYRQMAYRTVVDRLAAELQTPDRSLEQVKRSLQQEGEARFLAERLFATLDRKRERSQQRALEQAIELAKSGKLDQAIARFDNLLAIDPYHPRRQQLAEHYFRRGRQLQDEGNHRRAAILLTKAIHLAPEASFVEEAKALRSLAAALAQKPESRAGEQRVLAALALAPDLPATKLARQNLERLRDRRGWLVVLLGAGLALCLMAGLVVLRRRLL